MRHGCKVNHLSRTHAHRVAMLSNMATSLIMEKRIETTLAKHQSLERGHHEQSPRCLQLPPQQRGR